MNNKYSHDNKFFDSFSLEACYWAGFIAADGSLDETNKSLRLRLGKKDENHVRAFKNAIKFTGPTYDTIKTNSFGISIYSAEDLFYSLENGFNITSNKSLTLKPPNELDFYGADHIKSYMVGYIDGDGCIKICNRDSLLILDVFSGSNKITSWFKHKFEEFYDLRLNKIYSYGSKNHTLRISGTKAKIILDDLNKLYIPKLSRKWNKVFGWTSKRTKKNSSLIN